MTVNFTTSRPHGYQVGDRLDLRISGGRTHIVIRVIDRVTIEAEEDRDNRKTRRTKAAARRRA